MKPTYEQIARDFDLWQEWADTYGVLTREQFDAEPYTERLQVLIEAFGPEPEPAPA